MAFFSFLSSKKSDKIISLPASEFRKLITENSIQLVDVRTPDEYNQRKMEGAQLIDIYNPNFDDLVNKNLDVSIPVAVYCHSGVRSMSAAKIMASKGFSVYNLRGGILFWKW